MTSTWLIKAISLLLDKTGPVENYEMINFSLPHISHFSSFSPTRHPLPPQGISADFSHKRVFPLIFPLSKPILGKESGISHLYLNTKFLLAVERKIVFFF